MAFQVPKSTGFSSMLKSGARAYSGIEEAVYRNITACKELSDTVKSAYGPMGMNKIIVNHIEKLFVTNDAATIIREMEVQHPAAKMIVLASMQQEEEAGDGTNWVLLFAGSLLHHAEKLLKNGLALTEIIKGYEMARDYAIETVMPDMVVDTVQDLTNVKNVAKAIKTSLSSKQFGYEDFLSELIAQTCVETIPKGANLSSFSVENVRICKIVGGGITSSSMIKGMVFKRLIESDIKKVDNAVIAAFSCPLDNMTTETKGTVLLKTADELMNFSKGEETLLEKTIGGIAAQGVNCIVSGGKVSDMALHFCNKYNIMVLRLMSKWDLRRLCKTVGATCLPKMGTPTKEELGYCQNVRLDGIGEQPVVIFERGTDSSRMCTILIRGATDNILDDVERAVDDGVNNFKMLSKTSQAKLVAGAGAVEMGIATRVAEFGKKLEGLEQYSVEKFAEALEIFPRVLSDNAGLPAQEVISMMYNAHGPSKPAHHGVDIETNAAEPELLNSHTNGIVEPYETKKWALKFAVDAACTVLSVDSLIMSKPAGGPKPRDQKPADWDDEE